MNENEENEKKTVDQTDNSTADNTIEKTTNQATETTEENTTSEAKTGEEKKAEEETPLVDTPADHEDNKPDSIGGEYNGKKGANDTIDQSYFKPIKYVNDSTRTIDEDIELTRKTYMAKIGKSKTWDIVSIVLMVVSFVAVIIVSFTIKDESLNWVIWTVIGIAVAVIIGSFVLASVFNKKNSKVAEEYLGVYEDMVNGYTLTGLDVTDPVLCSNAKISDEEIIQAHYFRTINSIQSRALVEGKRKDLEFQVAEVAVVIPPKDFDEVNAKPTELVNLDDTAYVPSPVPGATVTSTQELPDKDMTMIDLDLNGEVNGNDKEAKKRQKDKEKAAQKNAAPHKTSSGLFGRIFSWKMCVSSEEAFIISYMGDKQFTVLPDFLTGFEAVHVPGLRTNIVVYCVNPTEAAKFFDEEGVKILNSITVSMTVQSAFISINSYGSKLALTLSDDIMSLPLKTSPHVGTFDEFKTSVHQMFAYADYVDSKKDKIEA